MTFKQKPTVALLAFGLAGFAAATQAQTPGLNVLNNPQFYGQTTSFQTTDGPFATDWNYSPGYDFFGPPGLLVSQTLATGDLYYYNIAFNLGTTTAEGGVDFAVLWDGTFVQNVVLSPSTAWSSVNLQVTAEGPTSEFGLVGNTAFWSSLDNLAVSWNGNIDPPPSAVPDSPLSFGFEAAVLLGLGLVARFYGRDAAGLLRPKSV